MLAATGRLLGLDQAAVSYGLRLAFAAWLAYAIASISHVHNAYWASMAVWVVAQPSRGLMFERGLFRIIGTLIGAAAGFAIVHTGSSPWLQLFLLALWIALNTGLTHLLPGVHAYGALMSGMTAGIVALPVILLGQHATDVAIARVECTLIGVLVVTVVNGLFTPRAPRRQLYQRFRQLAGDAVAYAGDLVLAPAHTAAHQQIKEARRILSEISTLEASSLTVSAGSIQGYRHLRHVHGLAAASLEVMAAGLQLQQRQARGEAPPPLLAEHLHQLAAHLRDSPSTPLSEAERTLIESPSSELTHRLSFALAQLLKAETALFWEAQKSGSSPSAQEYRRPRLPLPPDRNWLAARQSAVITGLVTPLAAVLAYWSGSIAGELAALGVCIFSIVLGSAPTPKALAPNLFKGVVAGVCAAMLYRFAIQPHISTPAQLILSMAPFILVGGLARASHRTAMPALDANMCFMLASQAVLPAITDVHTILIDSAALVVAAGVVVAGFLWLPQDPDRRLRKAAIATRRDLTRLLHPGNKLEYGQLLRHLLRLTLHLSRTEATLKSQDPSGLLAILNAAHTLEFLHKRLPTLTQAEQQVGTLAFDALGEFASDPVSSLAKVKKLALAYPDSVLSPYLHDLADELRSSLALLDWLTTPNSQKAAITPLQGNAG